MKFLEAVAAMKEGKTVTRAYWGTEAGYLVTLPGAASVWRITLSPTVNAGNHLFTIEDYEADDWQVSNGANPLKEEVAVDLESVGAEW